LNAAAGPGGAAFKEEKTRKGLKLQIKFLSEIIK
jgi:hypothetical protein